MTNKKDMDKFQENSISNNNAGRSADREAGDKGGSNAQSQKNQQTAIDKKRTPVQGP